MFAFERLEAGQPGLPRSREFTGWPGYERLGNEGLLQKERIVRNCSAQHSEVFRSEGRDFFPESFLTLCPTEQFNFVAGRREVLVFMSLSGLSFSLISPSLIPLSHPLFSLSLSLSPLFALPLSLSSTTSALRRLTRRKSSIPETQSYIAR